ncbi:uncharacterized protein Z518_09824 [Rhinocladiella mackenziei CBS 650.93]|uniref:HAUS augmin-like complex subunit 1 n=1 Tax=Rhinocladiella mackenziei CBS 650.93 TaxID=1442369 RepID=A0A0D2I4M2_9EURO|nr:uncharacterized protein Z518_09824 [Rhinocladiella mackenziei CBS 650.93]KIX00759.1 hypothetical protein Z518_09824 [Rhinocladiella mackenziei CBS 650.93]
MQASPSKARAQALESHSWSVVLSWLSNLYYPSPIPSFECNTTTLRALQSLMTENLAVERTRELLYNARIEELVLATQNGEQIRAQPPDGSDAGSLLSLLESYLPPSSKRALDSLANSAVLLGCHLSPSSPASTPGILQNLQSQILALPRQTFNLESQISAIDTLTSTLSTEIAQTEQCLSGWSADPSDPETTSPPSSPSPTNTRIDYSALHDQTRQHQREANQLMLKSAEYKDRIAALERQGAGGASAQTIQGPTLTDLAIKQDLVERKKKQAEALEKKILAFHGLPPDLEVSRAEVLRAQTELDALKRRRDELFEKMGG